MIPAAGQILGRYELLIPIAKGGMAQVWAARLRGTRGFKKIVAVKTILAGTIDDARLEQMFLEEATLASQIHHPNVVGTLELGEHEGMLYLVMEWVDGESLNVLMSRAAQLGGIPLSIAVNLVGQACKGLHAAHDLRDESGALLGLVHRDISAQNVLVTYSGNAKLVDFGIAKATMRCSSLTVDGELKGKFAYMSPEQVHATAIDRRSDIFGMGVILYLVTTGRHPFKGTHPAETLHNICDTKPPVPPSILVRGYPPELEAVVQKALRKAPEDRWATANEMLSALERAMPQALDGSFEVQVAEYMDKLLGERARERRAQLRRAQEIADQLRTEITPQPGAGSQGSLRAVLVEGASGESGSTRSADRATRPEIPSAHAAAEAPSRLPIRTDARWVRVAAAIFGLLLAWMLTRLFRTHESTRTAAATSPVPSATESGIAEAPVAGPVPSPSWVAEAGPTSMPEVTDDRREPTAAKAVHKVAGAMAPRPSATGQTPLSTGNAAVAPTAERPRAAGRDGAAPNAWDPATFGGRR